MANKALFASRRDGQNAATDAQNKEGAWAYKMEPRHRLAQIAVTGTLNQTFYANAEEQLDAILEAAMEVDPAFVAKTAIYARERGFMKDTPALLLAWLSMLQTPDFSRAFGRIVDNGKMLRNFVQIMRSGATGRTSLGTRPKRMVKEWLETASDMEIMRAAVGQSPSLADVIKMVHPKPKDPSREALYGYLIGKPYDAKALPDVVKAFEAFKADRSRPLPDVPFQMLTALPLTKKQWAAIGHNAGWHMLRMNLATFARHEAFSVKGFTAHVAKRLRDPSAIAKARVLPYQLMVAYTMTAKGAIPEEVREALQDAMEIAIDNVPSIEGRVVICPDVSGSMSSPVTGYRQGATTVVRCVDVAGLIASAFLRANREARVLPFAHDIVRMDLNPRDSVMTNAEKLASAYGGGTNCSAPIARLIKEKAKVDLVVIVSDNESWVDGRPKGRGTGLMNEWTKLKAANPKAKLVCIDIQPYGTLQAVNRSDILNVGGFSDAVFNIVAAFAKDELGPDYWAGEIDKIEL